MTGQGIDGDDRDELRELLRQLREYEDRSLEDLSEEETQDVLELLRRSARWQQKHELETDDAAYIVSDGLDGTLAREIACQRLGAATGRVPKIDDSGAIEVIQDTSTVLRVAHTVKDGLDSAETTRLRGLWPITQRHYHESCTELVEQGIETSFVFNEGAYETLQEQNETPSWSDQPTGREWLASLDAHDHCDLYVSDAINLELFVLDDMVYATLLPYLESETNQDSTLMTCVCGTDTGLHEWAMDVFEDVRQRADRVHVESVSASSPDSSR